MAKKLPGSLRNSVPRCQGSAGGSPCCVRIVWLLAICFGCNRAQPGTPSTWWLCPPASSGSASSPKRRARCPHGFLPALSPSFVPLDLSLTDCLQPAWFDLGSTFCSVLSPPEKGLQEGYPHAAIHPRGWENGGALTALLASRFGAEHIPRCCPVQLPVPAAGCQQRLGQRRRERPRHPHVGGGAVPSTL